MGRQRGARDPGRTIPRSSSWPWILPLGLYLATGYFSAEPGAAQLAVYAARIGIVALAAWLLRRVYPRPARRGCLLAAGLGIPAAALWIFLAKLDLEAPLRAWIPAGWTAGARSGLDLDALGGSARWIFLALRLFGLILVVPFVEEIFWRGWLARWLVSSEFSRVAIGRFTRLSFLGVVVGFVLVHPEWIAAATWCALANLVVLRTRNLWAAIAFHASTNAVLGAWILAADDWSLW